MQRRLTTDEEDKLAHYVESYCCLKEMGFEVSVELAESMLMYNTTDGRPIVEPPITEDDAKERPWVMVRDDDMQLWIGPFVFIDKLSNGRYVCRNESQTEVNVWSQCRRATGDEIAAERWRLGNKTSV